MTNAVRQAHSDVIIVGGGMVGGAAALACAAEGLRVTLIESGYWPEASAPAASVSEFDLRVSALSPANLRFLTQLGVMASPQPTQRGAYDAMEVWDADGTGRIHFDAMEVHQAALGEIIENRVTVAALGRVLRQTPGVTVREGASVSRWASTAEGATVTVGDELLSASLVIAADGAQSRLRHWAALPTREWDYEHTAIVCTVETEHPHQRCARQVFTPQGPLAFLPLADAGQSQRFCSIVWSVVSDQADALMALDDVAFRARLEATIERALGGVEAVSSRQAIPLRQRHAKAYVKDRFALVGDAAHTLHPLAGQGANLGLQDVRVLADELGRAHRLGLDVGALSVLKRYQRRRVGENLAMMAAMEGFKRLFAAEEPILRWLRNAGLRFVDGQGVLKHAIMREAMGA